MEQVSCNFINPDRTFSYLTKVSEYLLQGFWAQSSAIRQLWQSFTQRLKIFLLFSPLHFTYCSSSHQCSKKPPDPLVTFPSGRLIPWAPHPSHAFLSRCLCTAGSPCTLRTILTFGRIYSSRTNLKGPWFIIKLHSWISTYRRCFAQTFCLELSLALRWLFVHGFPYWAKDRLFLTPV